MKKEKTEIVALIWPGADAAAARQWLAPAADGRTLLQCVVNDLWAEQVQRTGILVDEHQKRLLARAADPQAEWLTVPDISDFGRSILLAEDWFKGFEGEVLLIAQVRHTPDRSLIRRLIHCPRFDRQVACLPLFGADEVPDGWWVHRDADGRIRELTETAQGGGSRKEKTTFPWLFDWDCLQRALYQVGDRDGRHPLNALIEKVTDNGFEIGEIEGTKTEQPDTGR